jgi:hypothetical protein
MVWHDTDSLACVDFGLSLMMGLEAAKVASKKSRRRLHHSSYIIEKMLDQGEGVNPKRTGSGLELGIWRVRSESTRGSHWSFR